MTFDYTSLGFYTFDCLGRPVTDIPPGGGTYFIDELDPRRFRRRRQRRHRRRQTRLKVQAVGGVGDDDMGKWVLEKLQSFDVDTVNMELCRALRPPPPLSPPGRTGRGRRCTRKARPAPSS